MSNNIITAYLILADVYTELDEIKPYTKRIEASKKLAIKFIINKCQCNNCIEAAYFIHQLEFFI
jgi:hypothetical protein